MASRVLPPSGVLPTSEARATLTAITAEFREHGAASGLVVFGSRRRPEAAIVPYELIELLDPLIEDLVIAARVRERLAEDDGTRYSLDEVAAEFGLVLDDRARFTVAPLSSMPPEPTSAAWPATTDGLQRWHFGWSGTWS